MPEEINRIMCDHVSTLLFSPTSAGFKNLVNEGFKKDPVPPYNANNPKIYHCGDVMYDNSLYFSDIAEKKSDILSELKVKSMGFILATIHRNNNTDDPARLNALFSSLQDISARHKLDIVLPLHPRTSKLLAHHLSPALYDSIRNNPYVKITEPEWYV
jgi:UDP-GlcNAc3NAcA epimerase